MIVPNAWVSAILPTRTRTIGVLSAHEGEDVPVDAALAPIRIEEGSALRFSAAEAGGSAMQHAPRVATFRAMVDRARTGAQPTPAMLAQIAGQARQLLSS